MKRMLLLTTIGALLTACGGPKVPVKKATTGEIEKILVPPIGEVAEAHPGDSMITSGFGWRVDCLVPSVDKTKVIKGAFGSIIIGTVKLWRASESTLVLKKGVAMCSGGVGGSEFKPPYPNWIASTGRKSTRPFTLVEGPYGGPSRLCVYVESHCLAIARDEYQIKRTVKYSESDVKQTIEYTGKNGDVLNFTYTESRAGMAREAFNRDFSVDLSQGKILSYKGAQIEILNAHATGITYKIISTFWRQK